MPLIGTRLRRQARELRLDTVPARLRQRGDPAAPIDDPRASCSAARARRPHSRRGSATRPGRRTSQAALRARARPAQPAEARPGHDLPFRTAARLRPSQGAGVTPPARAAAGPALALSRASSRVGDRYSTRSSSTASAACVRDGRGSTCSRATAGRSVKLLPRARLPAGALRARRRDRHARLRRARALRRPAAAHPPGAPRASRCSKGDPRGLVAFDLLAQDDDSLLDAASERRRARWKSRSPAARTAPAMELMAAGSRRAQPWLRGRRADRQEALRALPPRQARRHVQGQARPHHRRRRRRLAAGQGPDTVGALILGLYDGPSCASSATARASAREKRRLVGFLGQYQTGGRGTPNPAVGRRARSGVGRAAPRTASSRWSSTTCRGAHPPWRQAASLA